MPSRIWYAVAAGVFCLSVLASAALTLVYYPELEREVGAMPRLPVPGQGRISFSEGGEYAIYYELKNLGSSDLIEADDVPDIKIEFREEQEGKTSIELGEDTGDEPRFLEVRWGSSYAYSTDNRSGVSIRRFVIAEPGTYHVTAAYGDGRSEPAAELAIGKGIDQLIMLTSGSGPLLFFGGITVSVVLLAWTYFKRQGKRTA